MRWVEEAEPADDEHVLVRLLSGLRDIAERRTANNKTRARNYDTVVSAAQIALTASAVELIIALVVRL